MRLTAGKRVKLLLESFVYISNSGDDIEAQSCTILMDDLFANECEEEKVILLEHYDLYKPERLAKENLGLGEEDEGILAWGEHGTAKEIVTEPQLMSVLQGMERIAKADKGRTLALTWKVDEYPEK